MSFAAELADIRFGCGLSPVVSSPNSTEVLLGGLLGPDEIAGVFPMETFDEALRNAREFRRLRTARTKAEGTKRHQTTIEALDQFNKHRRSGFARQFVHSVLRQTYTKDGFRERLTLFWGDHFTATTQVQFLRFMGPAYLESVIRPRITGRFSDLLFAVVTNPLMLYFLDQHRSIGPNSKRSRQAEKDVGLNENLAREVLELHTLGVDGPYSQQDVRQLAELFTGLTFSLKDGFRYAAGMAEPGAEIILGRRYGDDGRGQLDDIRQALEDLANHPATARHIAQKLAVHFVSDNPDPDLVAHLEARYHDSGGLLSAVYEAMMEHPASWTAELRNVKPPFDYVASACRALAVGPDSLQNLKPGQVNRFFLQPLRLMGQHWTYPNGPDGWNEADEAWITPQGLATRLRWAMAVPTRLMDDLPFPPTFAEQVLGAQVTERVRFAAAAAETRSEGIGLVLASPSFQRR